MSDVLKIVMYACFIVNCLLILVIVAPLAAIRITFTLLNT